MKKFGTPIGAGPGKANENGLDVVGEGLEPVDVLVFVPVLVVLLLVVVVVVVLGFVLVEGFGFGAGFGPLFEGGVDP